MSKTQPDQKIIRLGRRFLSHAQAIELLVSNTNSAKAWLLEHHAPYRLADTHARKEIFTKLYTLTVDDLLWIAGKQEGKSVYSGDDFTKFDFLSIGRKDPKAPFWSRDTTCLGEREIHLRRGKLSLEEWFGLTRRSERIAAETGQVHKRYRVVRVALGGKPKKPNFESNDKKKLRHGGHNVG